MTPQLDELADRHFRPDPQRVLGEQNMAHEGRVLLAINPGVAATKAGQDTLWMLTNLLCRQFRLVKGIGFDVPSDAELLPRVAAFGEAQTLIDTVTACVQSVAGRHVDVVPLESGGFDFEIVIGNPATDSRAAVRLIVFADGWRLYVGQRAIEIANKSPTSSAPLGPYLAACFAAGEVFKRLRGLKPGRGEFIDADHPLFLSVWTGISAPNWDLLAAGPAIESVDLPPLYFVGAGAVAQSVALTIAGLSDVHGHITIVDHDKLDVTNDNRYALATIDDDQEPKAPLLGAFLERRGLTAFPYPGTWQAYVSSRDRETNRPDLAAFERRYQYRFVLSCVDDNGARHAVQNLWPETLLGGSTYGLTAKATVYDMAGSQLCLKCFNPVIERNEIIKTRLEEARRMAPEQRMTFFQALGVDPTVAEEHLNNPGCGQLTEDDLNRFAAGPPMMSVGFVSVAAGVLLVAQTLRTIWLPRPEVTANGATLIANFYKPAIRWMTSLPETGCDCVERRASDWARQWPRNGLATHQ